MSLAVLINQLHTDTPRLIHLFSPSLTNLDNTCSRNLDMAELDYNPSKKDLTDAKIHHLLAEELKPYRRVCTLRYILPIRIPSHSFVIINFRLDILYSKAV